MESTLHALPRFISTRTLCVHHWSWLQIPVTLRMSGVHTVLSSTSLLSSCRRLPGASVVESVYHVLGPPLSCCLCVSSSIVFSSSVVLPCLFMRCPKQGSFGFVISASSAASDLIHCRAHLFPFRAVHFRGVQFFLSAFFTVQLSHPCMVPGRTSMWVVLALVSKDMSLLLVISPNSSSAALWSLSLLLGSLLWFPFELMIEPR